MSNISATNIAISGTCAFSGTVSLAQPLISGSTGNYQGIISTDLRTTGNVLFDTLPKCNVLPTLSSQLTTKSYVDSKNTLQDTRMVAIEGVNTTQTADLLQLNTRLTTNEATDVIQRTDINDLSIRVLPLENHLTNISYDAVSDTTNVMGSGMFILNSPLVGTAGSESNSLQTKGYIDSQDGSLSDSIVNLETRAGNVESRATNIETINTSQSTAINSLQQKTNHIVYTTPVGSSPMTEITSGLSLLPFNFNTIMKAFSLSCNNILCTTQATFGGVGPNRGITTSQLTVGGFGDTFKTVYFGSVTSVNGTSNLVTFTTPLTGPTFPKIILTPIGTSTGVVLLSKTLSGFVFSANGVYNIDWICIQGL